MPNIEAIQSNNFNLIKMWKITWSSLSGIIGISTTINYISSLNQLYVGLINALLYSGKLSIDIKNIIKISNTKSKLLIIKILCNLGIIGLINYSKFVNTIIKPVEPITRPFPIITTSTISSTTNVDPFPPDLLLSINNTNTNNSLQMDLYNYLIVNCECSLDIVIDVIQLINNLITIKTNNIELQETSFTNDTARLINASVNNYGSNDSIDSLTSDVIYERPIYCSTTIPIN